ncbi:MAG: polysaccharide biosynthesis C-terminal domain-containing protein, partial [Christensenellales bacterium]
FSAQILHLLYPSLSGGELAMASKLLVISSSTVLSLAVFYISTSILQGFGKSYFPCVNAGVCSVLRILSYIILISFYDIYAVAISSCVWYLVMAVININHMLKFACIDLIGLGKIFASSIVFIAITFCIFACLVSALGSFAFVVGAVFGGFVYLLLNIKLLLNE